MKATVTPTNSNYFIYRATALRTYLVGEFEKMTPAHAYAKDCSIGNLEDVFSVVNSNGVCCGKYRNSKYFI